MALLFEELSVLGSDIWSFGISSAILISSGFSKADIRAPNDCRWLTGSDYCELEILNFLFVC